MARLVPITREDALPSALGDLKARKAVALPTETVYGLAANACDEAAAALIFEMKGRPSFNPLICHVDGVEMARRFGEFNETATALARRFWPGPLTLVLPLVGETGLAAQVTAGLGTVALRQPAGFMARLISAFGSPLAAPSANKSGGVSPTTAMHVAREYADTDLLVLDGGRCSIGVESTIVKTDAKALTILRPGGITAEQLTRATGLPVSVADKDSGIVAPGMMASHYAPSAGMRLDVTDCPPQASLLAFGPGNTASRNKAVRYLNLSETGNLAEAAANLYAYVKALDEAGAEEICVEPIPETGIGVAINDRLRRASAPRSDVEAADPA